jgi:hypothetical protein
MSDAPAKVNCEVYGSSCDLWLCRYGGCHAAKLREQEALGETPPSPARLWTVCRAATQVDGDLGSGNRG